MLRRSYCSLVRQFANLKPSLMTEEQQNLIHLARIAAESHLSIMISSPEKYLATFRYGMDFVWGMYFPRHCSIFLTNFSKMCLLGPSSSQTSPAPPLHHRHASSRRQRKGPPRRAIQSARLQQHLLPHPLSHGRKVRAGTEGRSRLGQQS